MHSLGDCLELSALEEPPGLGDEREACWEEWLPRPQSKLGAMPPREGLESPPGAAGGELKSSALARHLPQSSPALGSI